MSFSRLNFTKLWTNPGDFPTKETNETRVRSDMQLLHNETRTALNNLMTALESTSGVNNIGVNFGGIATNIGQVISTWLSGKKAAIESLVTNFGSLTKTTSISSPGVDTKVPTEKAVATALSGKAASTHNHAASNITSGTLGVARGGTGVSTLDALRAAIGLGNGSSGSTGYPLGLAFGGTAATDAVGARTKLGLGSAATENVVPISKGGTGATTAAQARTNLGITPAPEMTWSNLQTRTLGSNETITITGVNMKFGLSFGRYFMATPTFCHTFIPKPFMSGTERIFNLWTRNETIYRVGVKYSGTTLTIRSLFSNAGDIEFTYI